MSDNNMKSYTAYGFTLNHNLNIGCFTFEDTSAIGKTYLGDIINMLNTTGFNGLYINGRYDTEAAVLSNLENAEDKSLVVIDNYDRYITDKITDRLHDIAKKTIVLVDAKIHCFDIADRDVYIERTENSITLCKW